MTVLSSRWHSCLPAFVCFLITVFLNDNRAHLRHLFAHSWWKTSLTNHKEPTALLLMLLLWVLKDQKGNDHTIIPSCGMMEWFLHHSSCPWSRRWFYLGVAMEATKNYWVKKLFIFWCIYNHLKTCATTCQFPSANHSSCLSYALQGEGDSTRAVRSPPTRPFRAACWTSTCLAALGSVHTQVLATWGRVAHTAHLTHRYMLCTNSLDSTMLLPCTSTWLLRNSTYLTILHLGF